MAVCKFCGDRFDWGRLNDKWVPLVPIDLHDGMMLTMADSNGNPRADHNKVCAGRGKTVTVTMLSQPVPAPMVEEDTRYDPTREPQPRMRKRRRIERAALLDIPFA